MILKCEIKLLIHPFHFTLYGVCDYLSIMGLKLIHVNKRGRRKSWYKWPELVLIGFKLKSLSVLLVARKMIVDGNPFAYVRNHFGLAKSSALDKGQHWLRWLRHQAIIWTNVNFLKVRYTDIHLRAILQEISQISITKFSLKITGLILSSNLPSAIVLKFHTMASRQLTLLSTSARRSLRSRRPPYSRLPCIASLPGRSRGPDWPLRSPFSWWAGRSLRPWTSCRSSLSWSCSFACRSRMTSLTRRTRRSSRTWNTKPVIIWSFTSQNMQNNHLIVGYGRVIWCHFWVIQRHWVISWTDVD